MGHSRSTADRWYNLVNKMKAASEAHNTVTSLLDVDGSSFMKDAKKSKDQQEGTESDVDGEQPEEDCKKKASTDPQDNDEVTLISGFSDVIPPSETACWDMSSICSTRRHWSRADTEKIMSVCQPEITGAAVPTRTSIIRKLRSNPETNDMLQSEGAERAYQKVKHMRRNYQMQNTK